jgi:hypothetical protein
VFLSYSCHYCHLCMKFTRRFSVYRELQPGVSLPSTCCFIPHSALLFAKFSTVVVSAVQGAGRAPAGVTHTRSSRPQILHNPFKRSGCHTSHVLPMEDVRRKLIFSCTRHYPDFVNPQVLGLLPMEDIILLISQSAGVDCTHNCVSENYNEL